MQDKGPHTDAIPPNIEDALPIAPQQRNGRHVTWAALLSILGALCAFFLSLLLHTALTLRAELQDSIDAQRAYIISHEVEARRDLRRMQDSITNHISPHEGLGQSGPSPHQPQDKGTNR